MKSKTKNNFNAVDFMRKIRNDLSDLYHADKKRYHSELKKTMADFLMTRNKPARRETPKA